MSYTDLLERTSLSELRGWKYGSIVEIAVGTYNQITRDHSGAMSGRAVPADLAERSVPWREKPRAVPEQNSGECGADSGPNRTTHPREVTSPYRPVGRLVTWKSPAIGAGRPWSQTCRCRRHLLDRLGRGIIIYRGSTTRDCDTTRQCSTQRWIQVHSKKVEPPPPWNFISPLTSTYINCQQNWFIKCTIPTHWVPVIFFIKITRI